jgi:hypothetical protein
MSKIHHHIFYNWNLSDRYIDIYAELISISKREMNDLPSPPVVFFQKRLRSLKTQKVQAPTVHVITCVGRKPVGWGHVSVYPDNPEKAELFVFIKKDHRNNGLGTDAIKELIKHTPFTVKEFDIPALLSQRSFLKNHFNSDVLSSEVRGLLSIKDTEIHTSTIHVYTDQELLKNPNLTDQILNVLKKNITVPEYHEWMKKMYDTFGKKMIFSCQIEESKIVGCIVTVHNFEENYQLAFVDEISQNLTSSQKVNLLHSSISFMRRYTPVEYYLTFDFDSSINIYQECNMEYINTLDHHIMKRSDHYVET